MTTIARSHYRSILPGLLLSSLSILVMLILGDVTRAGVHIAGFKWQFLAIAVSLYLFNHLLRFAKFALFLGRAGVRTLSHEEKVDLYISCSPFNASTTRISDSYQALSISKATGIPLSQADGITFISRISDIVGALILAAVGTLSYPAFWPFFVVLFGAFLLASFSLKLKPFLPPVPPLNAHRSRLRTAWESVQWITLESPALFSAGTIIITFLLQSLAWLAQSAALFAILVGFGYEPTLALTATSCLVLAFAMLAGILSNLPGGLGVVELSMATMLTVLLDFQPDLAIVVTILFRAATFWIGFLFGILVWPETVKSARQDTGAIRVVKS